MAKFKQQTKEEKIAQTLAIIGEDNALKPNPVLQAYVFNDNGLWTDFYVYADQPFDAEYVGTDYVKVYDICEE